VDAAARHLPAGMREVDALELLVVVDNETDTLSSDVGTHYFLTAE